ncbi:MAG: C4-dicarboxylate ABC transporter permease [Betaproteobacteria bacterium RIFCSPLOWO2_02_67_12]|nr:MAG: C4-dicarboxylate ABC transporter permease [Betaproteobacteria bacterium RIFCSPLOWO2_02_67_12]OGA26631.1 MAG: C4-dicarboxylate ABC transporter permease [Betaproteobacteria bacterium RIFCSPLOWO2_02_FULL_68_150]OGA64318.1 MAG: C4-dicarboxylate ABC transporter permease [Betaproteobacteria bacterium RIFCSPLOWO2_12_FULL_67_28]
MERLSLAWGKVLEAFALAACALLGAMTLMICADVLLRNVALIPGVQGLPWSNELSETTLYVVTMLAAPWLLREGRHIRVDIVLRALPARAGWACEWLCDAIALACCVCVAIYATRAAWESFSQGSISIKTLVLPEWWTLAPLPVAFLLLSVELLFRMRRLWLGPRTPREDAVSSA